MFVVHLHWLDTIERQLRDSGSCREDLVFAIFNSYVLWAGPFYTPPARLKKE